MEKAEAQTWQETVTRHRRAWRDRKDPVPTGVKILAGYLLFVAGGNLLQAVMVVFNRDPVALLGIPLALGFGWLGSTLLRGSSLAVDLLVGLCVLAGTIELLTRRSEVAITLYAVLIVYLLCIRPLLRRKEALRAEKLGHRSQGG